MTRINLVHPSELSDQHLMAEYRELPRMVSFIQAWISKGCPEVSQRTYTMGKGHMKFFLNKSQWLTQRHSSIVQELIEIRQYNITNKSPLVIPSTPFENYPVFDSDGLVISRDRIKEKLRLRPNFYTWTNRERPDWTLDL